MTQQKHSLKPIPFEVSSTPDGYNWDVSKVAFSDPLETLKRREEKREAERTRESKRGKRKRIDGNSKNFHLKHG